MSEPVLNLNESALELCEEIVCEADRLRAKVINPQQSARLIDCGVEVEGGLELGKLLAEICLAKLGRVDLVSGDSNLWDGPFVAVTTDQPVAACMASQYAGWQITGEKYFAMGSGPMRAACCLEDLFKVIGYQEQPSHVVGVLESGKLPPADVCQYVAEACNVEAKDLTLLVARTASMAGTVQIVARSVETVLHKMHELDFDILRVKSGFGVAPLPPVAADDLIGIGRTNDAVLYGGEATLWITGDDRSIEAIGPQIPSLASPDHGRPFGEIFEQYKRDFYKIDPLLFSPAVVTIVNLDTGRMFRYGETRADVLRKSFAV